jgi:tetratricopeptide (TPR) repeat protein
VQLRPRSAESHIDLGSLLKEKGELDAAVKCYSRALELSPQDVNALMGLGHALQKKGALIEARAHCRRAVELQPENAEAHNALGDVLKEQGTLDEALLAFRRAIELRPTFAECLSTLGTVFEELGRFPEAEESLRAAVRYNCRPAFAQFKLAEILRGKLAEEDLARHQNLLADPDLTDTQRFLLLFGLARVCDAKGDYAAAAGHLAQANALQRADFNKRGRPYNRDTYEALAAGLIEACTPEFFRRVRDFSLDTELPVFVVGLPRSGTTLVEQVLASHPQVFGAGEILLAGGTLAGFGGDISGQVQGLQAMDRETAARAAQQHIEKLASLAPAAQRIVDKLPENYLHLGMLAALFPRARFIHCRRDFRDVALSCWTTPFGEVRWANDQDDIVARVRVYRQIMDHWRQVLPVPIMEVDYEDTVGDLEGVARRLVAFCGLEWAPSCLEFHRTERAVATASAVQVRQPVYKTSVQRWRNYAPYLAPLFARLEDIERS